jgi:putative adenylate-forming enzyme
MNSPALSILASYWRTQYLRQFRDRSDLTSWQHRRVTKFLAWVMENSEFYRAYYAGYDLENWRELPIVDKSIVMANFDRLNTIGVSQETALAVALQAEGSRDFTTSIDHHTVGLSSGTSGHRGLFLVSQQEQQQWAGTILAKALPRSILYPQKIAFFLRANSRIYETVKRQHIQFEYFDLFQEPSQHLKRLAIYQPSILVAPPSMLRIIAEAQAKSHISIHPRKVISVAEVLDPLDRTYLQSVFQQPIHQIYQCTEGFLGYTCDRGTLHLNEDLLVIQKEYIDRAARKFMPIVTDFQRRTQPFIRYRLDDILTAAEQPCSCGSVLMSIETIEGRKDDMFYFPRRQNAQELVPIFPDFIRRAVIMQSAIIQEYQVTQVALDRVEISLKLSQGDAGDIEQLVAEALRHLFDQQGCQLPGIYFTPYVERHQHHQKLRRIRREFNPAQGGG